MRPTILLLCVLSLTAMAHGCPDRRGLLEWRADSSSQFHCTCHEISAAISSASEIYFPPASQHISDDLHAYASSSEESACSVEPGSAEDVSKILCIVGSTRTPFAVKGGGHTSNPGFSSTKGVQIAMTRFKDIKVNTAAATVEVGAGLTWDQVYLALEPYGVSVVGGRVPGIGVAGLTLGGGFSWKSRQYGPTVDNVAGYELVLPNGTIASVTSNDEDLWFGLRGGLNNFGIVTKFIFKSYKQSEVWGGFLIFPSNQLAAVKNAVLKFQHKNDIKATAAFSLTYSSNTPEISTIATLYYDGSTPPPEIFDDLLAIPTIQKDVSSRSFYDLVYSLNFFNPPKNVSTRGYTSGVPVTWYSSGVFDAFVNQTNLWGERLLQLNTTFTIVATLEPFDSGLFSHGSVSAYPPDRSQAIFPSVLLHSWSDASLDQTFARAIRKQTDALRDLALADGQNVSHAAVYVNNALFDTPLKDIYGENLPRLRKIRTEIDPEDVMGLTGGFKF